MDPSWKYDNPMVFKGIIPPYKTLSDEELEIFPIQKLADTNALLLMWVTSPMMDRALKLIKSYGFTYKTIFLCWVKHKGGKPVSLPGSYSRSCTEYLLIATKGNVRQFITN